MSRITQLPFTMEIGRGLITQVTLGARCPHCRSILRVGDTPYCPHQDSVPPGIPCPERVSDGAGLLLPAEPPSSGKRRG